MTTAPPSSHDASQYAKAGREWRASWVRPVDAPNIFLTVESEGLKSIGGRMVRARCLHQARWGWVDGAGGAEDLAENQSIHWNAAA